MDFYRGLIIRLVGFLFISPWLSIYPRTAVAVEPVSISFSDQALNFGLVYAAQWGSYLLTQQTAIQAKGSFENWKHYPFLPHFDKDGMGYNLFGHMVAGQYYYLFYRCRGYSKPHAFLGAMTSSIAYEFTVETVTEPPSFQDLYQTPVLGSVVGAGMETLSDGLWATENVFARGMALVFNPFRLFKRESPESLVWVPVISPHVVGTEVAWRF